MNSFFFGFDYIAPLMFTIISFTHASPVYATLKSFRNFERFGTLYSSFVLIISGIPTAIGGLFLMATMGTCFLISAYGVVCVYVWTFGIVPTTETFGLPFTTAIHMHNCLRYVAILHSELARDFVTICLHHAALVVLATVGMYNIIIELAKGNEMSVMLICICVGLISVAVMLEIFSIYFIGISSKESKRFVREMRRKYGDRYRQTVLKSLLPNCINLEVVSSVDTLKNGIQMEYFINYFTRVTENTVNLLLTKK